MLICLVLLTHFGSGVENDIYFFKPKMGRVKDKYFTQRSFMYPALTKNILFLHAVSGCDTTNALFDKGKKKIADILIKYPDLQKKS